MTQGYSYRKHRITFEKLLKVILWAFVQILWNIFSIIYFLRNLLTSILQCSYKKNIKEVKDEATFISSGLKMVERLWRRKYDPVIIERSIGLVFGHATTFSEETKPWSTSPLYISRLCFSNVAYIVS